MSIKKNEIFFTEIDQHVVKLAINELCRSITADTWSTSDITDVKPLHLRGSRHFGDIDLGATNKTVASARYTKKPAEIYLQSH